jgi:hypothetical protein
LQLSGNFIISQLFYTDFLENARESDHSDLLAELEILKKINKEPHPNVIRFIGGCSMEGKM